MPALAAAKGRFKTELDPGKNAIQTGETFPSKDYKGRAIKVPVYRERTLQTKLVPRLDPISNQPIPKLNSANKPMGGYETQRVIISDPDDPALTKPEKIVGFVEYEIDTTPAGVDGIYLVREYIPVDPGNGAVRKNFAFRPTKAQLERVQKEAQRARALEAIGSLEPDQLMRLLERAAGEDEA